MGLLLAMFLACGDANRPLSAVSSKTTSGKRILLGGIETAGELDRWMVDALIKKRFSEIRYCVERELVKQPGLKGELVVKLVLSPTGKVLSSRVSKSTLGSPAVERCLEQRLKQVDFPNSRNGQKGFVDVPIAIN